MKILFYIPTMKKGGAERVISNLTSYICNNTQDEVSLLITIDEKPSYNLDPKVSFYILEPNIKGNILKRNIKRNKKLLNIIKQDKPDVIVAFLPEPCYRILLLKPFHKVPVIVSERNDPKVMYKDILNKILMKTLYPKASGFVFQTKEAKSYFKKSIQKNSVIIPNPINEEFISNDKKLKKEKVIVSVGRLEKQKNQSMLIDAFSNIYKKYPKYKLIIYGEGSLREKLENQIKSLNLENKVLLPGNIDNIKDALSKSEIFVLPSLYEGMPNALMEAMALGLPCISTDCPCGGPKFLIKHKENGLLTKIDSKDLEKNLELLITNKKLRDKISKNAIKIIDDLNPDKINKKWHQYIIKVGNDNKRK